MSDAIKISPMTEAVIISMLIAPNDATPWRDPDQILSRFLELCDFIADLDTPARRMKAKYTGSRVFERQWPNGDYAVIRNCEINRLTFRYQSRKVTIHELDNVIDISLGFLFPAAQHAILCQRLMDGEPLLLGDIAQIQLPGGVPLPDHPVRRLVNNQASTTIITNPVYSPWREASLHIRDKLESNIRRP